MGPPGLVTVEVPPHVSEPLPVLAVEKYEDDRVEEDGDEYQAVHGHLSLQGHVRQTSVNIIAFDSELGTEHLHQLVNIVGCPGANEQEDEEDHNGGDPVVREIKSRRPGATELHDQSQEGKHEDNPGEDEGHDEEGEVDIVLRAVGVHEPEVEDSALAAVHGGHGPRGYGDAHSQYPGKRDGPLVHLGSSCADISTLRGVRLVFTVPEVQKQGSEYQKKGVDPLDSEVYKQIELAKKLREVPPRKLGL